MNAMIFAAGLGTRLGSITQSCPKALVEVGGEPMIKRVIDKLKAAGIDRIVVNVHHHAQMLIDYLQSNNNFGVKISISDERDLLLDTGGGLLKAWTLFGSDDPILLHNADILTDFDISEMMKRHNASDADVTLMVSERNTSRYLLFDSGMRMKGWTNVNSGEVRSPWSKEYTLNWDKLAFGGVHIVNQSIFPLLESFSTEPKFSITPFYTASCRSLDIRGFIPQDKFNWIDIGKPDSLTAAQSIVSGLRLKA